MVANALVFPSTAFAASMSASITYVSPPSTNRKALPGDALVFKFTGLNTSGSAVANPWIRFNPVQSGYSFTDGTHTPYAISGFNPPTSFTGTVGGTIAAAGSFVLSGATFTLPQSYTSRTFDFSITVGGVTVGGVELTPKTTSGSVAVNIVPHVLTASFSKSSVINNGVDSADLTVTVLDHNGCSNIQGGSVSANLSELGGSSSYALSYQSCAGDGKTATFVATGLSTTVASGVKSVPVSATDADGNAAGSDANFTSGDLSAAPTISVSTPTAPVVTVNSVSPSVVRGGQTVSATWQSSQTGSYQVYAGAGTTCGSGVSVDSGTVAAADTPIVSNFSSDVLSEGSNPVTVCVTNAEPTQGSAASTVVKDTTAPTVSVSTYSPSSVIAQDVLATFSATESGSYSIFVNGSDTGLSGSYPAASSPIQVTVPNAYFTINPGDNAFVIKVTDSAGNQGASSSKTVTKDSTPPSPVSSVAFEDCDYVGNSGTVCASL